MDLITLEFELKLRKLQEYKGTSTSLVSIYIRPEFQFSFILQDITEEISKASNIKDKTNRHNVENALSIAGEIIKQYHHGKSSKNGLCIFTGVETENNIIKSVFEPLQPVGNYFMCSKEFYLEPLYKQINNFKKILFIVVDGNGYLFAIIHGSKKQIVSRLSVSLPKKHAKGGQSQQRFGRLRLEKIHNYVSKIIEEIIKQINQNKLDYIIIGGMGNIKNQVYDRMSEQYKPLIISTLYDVAYGDNMGLDQLIRLSANQLTENELNNEKIAVEKLFQLLSIDSKFIIYNKEQIINLLNDQLIAELYLDRNNENLYMYVELCIKDKIKLTLISDQTGEGMQFIKGFNGMMAITKYEMDDVNLNYMYEEENEDDFI